MRAGEGRVTTLSVRVGSVGKTNAYYAWLDGIGTGERKVAYGGSVTGIL